MFAKEKVEKRAPLPMPQDRVLKHNYLCVSHSIATADRPSMRTIELVSDMETDRVEIVFNFGGGSGFADENRPSVVMLQLLDE